MAVADKRRVLMDNDVFVCLIVKKTGYLSQATRLPYIINLNIPLLVDKTDILN